MAIVYALVARGKTVLAEFTSTSGEGSRFLGCGPRRGRAFQREEELPAAMYGDSTY